MVDRGVVNGAVLTALLVKIAVKLLLLAFWIACEWVRYGALLLIRGKKAAADAAADPRKRIRRKHARK